VSELPFASMAVPRHLPELNVAVDLVPDELFERGGEEVRHGWTVAQAEPETLLVQAETDNKK
jgi:hypothetical protein